jgi:AraC-like DNA-binding protein
MTYFQEHVERITKEIGLRDHVYERIIRTKQYIDLHFEDAINIKQLADQSFYSRFHFIRLFKTVYGRTPNQYVVELRIQKAKKLLQSGRSVTEVCHEVGFESIGSFSSLFKEITGTTPSSYKGKVKNQLSQAIHPAVFFYQHKWWQSKNSNSQEA